MCSFTKQAMTYLAWSHGPCQAGGCNTYLVFPFQIMEFGFDLIQLSLEISGLGLPLFSTLSQFLEKIVFFSDHSLSISRKIIDP